MLFLNPSGSKCMLSYAWDILFYLPIWLPIFHHKAGWKLEKLSPEKREPKRENAEMYKYKNPKLEKSIFSILRFTFFLFFYFTFSQFYISAFLHFPFSGQSGSNTKRKMLPNINFLECSQSICLNNCCPQETVFNTTLGIHQLIINFTALNRFGISFCAC